MVMNSKIEWTDHTFNPWWGCVRVSPGCEHCYAETFAKRTGHKVWGVQSERRFFGDKHWNEPLKWDTAAAKAGERRRVFCASMADVFEDRDDLRPHRARLFSLIEMTPNLDWLLLTKRPENADRLWSGARTDLWNGTDSHGLTWRSNVWLGTTAEDQKRADERIPLLLEIPAAVRFLSCEPLLEHVDLSEWLAPLCICHCCRGEHDGIHGLCPTCGEDQLITTWGGDQAQRLRDGTRTDEDMEKGPLISWVIVGGESGPGARRCEVAWVRSIVRQCADSRVRCFVKQLGAHPGVDAAFITYQMAEDPEAFSRGHFGGPPLLDRKGGDMSEWPPELRVRQFPEVRHG